MSVLVILIGVSISIAAGFLVSYLWAIKSGQYNDKHTPAMRILFDDGKVKEQPNSEIDNSKNKSSKNGAG